MHVAGFEPTMSNWKWIMSPLLSTTQPYMQRYECSYSSTFMSSIRLNDLKIHFK